MKQQQKVASLEVQIES